MSDNMNWRTAPTQRLLPGTTKCGVLLLVITLFDVSPAAAQQSRPARKSTVDKIAASQMDSALARTLLMDGKGAAFKLANDGNAQYLLNRRTGPSVVEMHCSWDDIVRSGAGLLHHSTIFYKLKKYVPWEWRAEKLVQASEVMLLPGDVVRIPAGVGHTISSLGDAPLVYLIVKMKSVEATPCGSLPNAGR